MERSLRVRSALVLMLAALALAGVVDIRQVEPEGPSREAAVSFVEAPGSPIAVGDGPLFIVAGDFNEDSHLDLSIVNGGSNDLSILLGDGSGKFSGQTNFTVGNSPTSAATGDFNEDGHLDLAVVNYMGGNVSILLGDGNGRFGSPTNFPVGGDWPLSVVVGDFNEDSHLDLGITNSWINLNDPRSFGDTIALLTGDGMGNFSDPVNFVVGKAPAFAVTGDFNEDGHLDLATANAATSSVSILLGDGNGDFEVAEFPSGYGPTFIITEDFYEDGHLDLITINHDDASILLGDGTGRFTLLTSFIGGNGPYGAVAGDFNEDGHFDLAVTRVLGFNNVVILIGNGKGEFTKVAQVRAGFGLMPSSIVAGDFNEDGHLDLAVAHQVNNNVAILLSEH
ncbi:MAG: FG-GAP repeat domain-containing protein [Candidatus Bipolaricaulia bacterium]